MGEMINCRQLLIASCTHFPFGRVDSRQPSLEFIDIDPPVLIIFPWGHIWVLQSEKVRRSIPVIRTRFQLDTHENWVSGTVRAPGSG